MAKMLARWRCHGNLWCCQYLDDPQCNSPWDPHWLPRWWRFARPIDSSRPLGWGRGTLRSAYRFRRDHRHPDVLGDA